jgi:hypothetical protein
MKPWTLPIAFVLACGVAGAQQESDTLPAIEGSVHDIFVKDSDPTEAEWLALIDRCWKLHDRSVGKPEEFETLYVALRITAFMPPESVKGTEQWRAAMGKIVSGFCDDSRVMKLMDDDMPLREDLVAAADQSFAKIAAATKSTEIKAAFDLKRVRSLLMQNSTKPLSEVETRNLVKMLKKLATDYPDMKVRNVGLTYRDWVQKTLFVVENLKIGHVVPDIEGPDLDGVDFKLSDYRGKVVMLDFWGHW